MMHKDLEEIYKILSLDKSKRISRKTTIQILNNICAKTSDASRKGKYAMLCDEKDNLADMFSPVIGKLADDCLNSRCNNCCITKWCNKYRNDRQKAEGRRKAPVYADFFSGAGGLSLGFYNAGFKLSIANDIQECCVDTFSLNHPEIPEKHVVAGDINEVLCNIKNLSRYKKVDVVAGGPPCQGFSMANRQRIIDDPRNKLYKSFIEALKILNPKFFVMENVRGMLNVKDQIIQDFRKIGYKSSAYILNAKDFGIPQNRERVIFIGNNIGADNERIFNRIFELGRSREKNYLADAIKDLPKLAAKNAPNVTEAEDAKSGFTIAKNSKRKRSEYVNTINAHVQVHALFNHKARYNNARDIEIFSRLNPGDDSSDMKIADIMPYKRRGHIFKDKYYKLEPDKPCKTITAHMKYDCNMYIHPSQARGLTPREAARVQSFPDDYFFRGAYTKTYMQIGNSVPPILAEVIATAIYEAIKEADHNDGK